MSATIREERLSPSEYTAFLKTTGLGSQYPAERFEERVGRLVRNASVSLTAREDGRLAGVLFGVTDFAYWLFVTDLGVSHEFEGRGIGRALMRSAIERAGGEKDIALYLVANNKAMPFYEKLGMEHADDVMRYDHTDHTPFIVE